MEELSNDRCDYFRRLPCSFNAMLRETYKAGYEESAAEISRLQAENERLSDLAKAQLETRNILMNNQEGREKVLCEQIHKLKEQLRTTEQRIAQDCYKMMREEYKEPHKGFMRLKQKYHIED